MTVVMKIGKIKHGKDLKGFGEGLNAFLHGQDHLHFMLKNAMKQGFNEWKKFKKTYGRNRPRNTMFTPMDHYNAEMTQETIIEDDVEWFVWTINAPNPAFEEDQYNEAQKIYESPKIMSSLRKVWTNTKKGLSFLKKYEKTIEAGEKDLKEKHKTIQNKLLDCGILTEITWDKNE